MRITEVSIIYIALILATSYYTFTDYKYHHKKQYISINT